MRLRRACCVCVNSPARDCQPVRASCKGSSLQILEVGSAIVVSWRMSICIRTCGAEQPLGFEQANVPARSSLMQFHSLHVIFPFAASANLRKGQKSSSRKEHHGDHPNSRKRKMQAFT